MKAEGTASPGLANYSQRMSEQVQEVRTIWETSDNRKVVLGDMVGRQAKDVFPTKPLVTLCTAS